MRPPDQEDWNWWLIPLRHLPRETETQRYNRQQVEAITRYSQKRTAEWKAQLRTIKEAYLAKAQAPQPEAETQAPPEAQGKS